MDKLEKKLTEIMELLKGSSPIIASPKAPALPKPIQPVAPKVASPSGVPASNKNPVNVAQQIQDPKTQKIAVKQAKNLVKFDKNGQWSL